MPLEKSAYLEKLSIRKRKSRAYRKYQLIGLEMAEVLGDRKHKALYIKLAKERDAELLLALAKQVAERKEVVNKGAYFMKCIARKAPKSKHQIPNNIKQSKSK
jgi:hypothetical protein